MRRDRAAAQAGLSSGSRSHLLPAGTSEKLPLDCATPEPVAQKRADALVRVAEGFLAGVDGDRPVHDLSGGDKYMVNIHTDIETLREDGTGTESELEECCRVPAETSRRLACDASLIRWLETEDGEPLSVGRKTRSIPPAAGSASKIVERIPLRAKWNAADNPAGPEPTMATLCPLGKAQALFIDLL